MRHSLGLAVLLGGLLLAAGSAGAADTAKNKHYVPTYNDPTIGVLGAHPGTSQAAGGAVKPNAVPPAPIAAGPPPKVEAESPVVTAPPTESPSSMAAPRPEAQVEGVPLGGGSPATPAHPQQVNTFLASHPVISGLVAGLVGTDIGSALYGGPMMGSESAAFVGFVARIGVVVLIALLAVRLVWGLIGKSDMNDLALPDSRREPSLGGRAEEFGGRREPTFGRSSPAPRERGEPTLGQPSRSPLSARRRF